jgi:uncharacterized protein (TIGR02147 family)
MSNNALARFDLLRGFVGMNTIFDYMDTCLFLQDYYRQRKEQEPTYSYNKWAGEVGFSNKTLLRLIVQGQRKITPKSKTAFKKFFGFDDLEGDYFDILVEYNQAKDNHHKQALASRLLEINRQKFSQRFIPVGSGILKDPYGPQVMTVVSSSESPISVEEVAEKIGINLTHTEAVLKCLVSADLIVERREGYTSNQPTFKVADETGSELRNYYHHWAQHSIRTMDLGPEKSVFRSVNLMLTPEEYGEVVQEINRISADLIARFKKNSLKGRKLFLLNLAFFPAKAPSEEKS